MSVLRDTGVPAARRSTDYTYKSDGSREHALLVRVGCSHVSKSTESLMFALKFKVRSWS